MYVDLLPLLNSARVDLLDDLRLISQLCNLERRNTRSGRDSIDHTPGIHDDLANAVAGLAASINEHGSFDCTYRWLGIDGDIPDDAAEQARQWRVARLMQHIAQFG